MIRRRKPVANLKVGRPDVRPDDPSHTRGIKEGNSLKNYGRQVGFLPDGTATAARSTGINPRRRDVIDPRMPSLSPS